MELKPRCVYCSSLKIIKKGLRKSKRQAIQKYFCKECAKSFTLKQLKNKSYPSKIILNAISCYNLGHSQEKVSNLISQRFKIDVPQRTISEWIGQYKAICTYSRLRKEAINICRPKSILFKKLLSHIQPYAFKYHKAKLEILTKENTQFATIKGYLQKINSKDFPHHIFTYINENKGNEQRASQIKFEYLKINHIQKQNQANELAKLALNLASTNKQRHESIQEFMLINDSTTIAVEIPVYITNWDAGYYRNQNGFIFDLSSYQTPITGHIDILQIRNGLIHILDYKPEPGKIQPIEQLTIYALALSRKLNLPIKDFKCAWFDENSYFEFFPLHAVYKKER